MSISTPESRLGFTLIALLVVIAIIGVLIASRPSRSLRRVSRPISASTRSRWARTNLRGEKAGTARQARISASRKPSSRSEVICWSRSTSRLD
nr:prepilin-type N-terminal cleavage/methylation domain-containing protein [Tautonia sociabilis]